MNNEVSFKKAKQEILDSFQHPDRNDHSRQRAESYKEYQKLSQERFRFELYDDQKMMLVGAGILLVFPLLNLLLNKISFRENIFFVLGVIVLIGGAYLANSILFGIVGVGVVGALNYFLKHFPGWTAVVCVIAALVLLALVYKDLRVQKNAHEYRTGSGMADIGKQFRTADWGFKEDLIEDMTALCGKYGCTTAEYDAAMEELFAEFAKPHPNELNKYLFTDTDKLKEMAEYFYREMLRDRKESLHKEETKQRQKPKDTDAPFLMYAGYTFYQKDSGLQVGGKIYRGTLRVGDPVDILGYGNDRKKQPVSRIRSNKKDVSEAKAGNEVTLYFADLKKDEVLLGQALAAVDSVTAEREFDALVLFEPPNIVQKPVASGSEVLFNINGRSGIKGTVTSLEGKKEFTANSEARVRIRLETPVVLEKGGGFSLQGSSSILASGKRI